jgi:TPR repeat protein
LAVGVFLWLQYSGESVTASDPTAAPEANAGAADEFKATELSVGAAGEIAAAAQMHLQAELNRRPLVGASAKDYAALRAGAESGDALAATQLYLVLKNCDKVSRETPDLEDLRNLQSAQVDVEATLAIRAEELEACAALPPNDIAERAKWLSLAANAGYIEAQLIFAVHAEDLLGGSRGMLQNPAAVQRHKAESMRHLNAAASTGSVKAIFVLADVYESGVLTPQDPVAAHGLRLAARALEPGTVTQQVIDLWGQGLTAEQRRAAEVYAREFLRQSRRG